MAKAMRAELVRRSEREAVLRYLSLDPLANLFLFDMTARLGRRPAASELRPEVAAVWRGGDVAAVAGLRPSIVFDAVADDAAVEVLVPLVETFGVGLVKSPERAAGTLWNHLLRRAPRHSVLDRYETAYVLRAGGAGTPEPGSPCARPARESDLGPLVVAARERLREEGRPDPFVGNPRGFRRWVRGRLPRARVVEDGRRIVFVGYADVQRREGWRLQGGYTWPEVRGQGIARAGVAALCREAFAEGADHVQLSVVEGNDAGVRLYEGLGFESFARFRTILFANA